ncbi:MAG TPA: RNA polymerase sigma factor [Thermoanaerobaculia bacterium]|nr:RNA polymerase sigma factor [Thermoanaerobaculia bacterium]HUM29426.1 RNA polymerase sigma factor [Thermoanaerobaculia bacterium]HXK67672.1 RNA polymerase sigma factor [Thermoanaerobaculia bacterium]
MRELLLSAQAGDTKAFETVMQSFEVRIIRFAWRQLGDRDEALDASQEIFLRLYRYLHRIDPDRDPGPWIFSIAVNVCRTSARKRGRHRLEPITESMEEGDALVSMDALPYDRMGQMEMVREGLAELTPKEREAILLRDVEGFSTRVVATILRSSEGTVRSHISRARLKLKAFRDEYSRRRV